MLLQMDIFNGQEEQEEDEVPYVPVTEEVQAEERAPGTCVLCLTNAANMVAFRCGHKFLCDQCRPDYTRRECCYCNQHIQDFVLVRDV